MAQALLSGCEVVSGHAHHSIIYEGAAPAGARYTSQTLPSMITERISRITPAQWRVTEMVYICSPGNPTGQLMSLDEMPRD